MPPPDTYRAAWETTQRMLAAAEAEAWDELLVLEGERAALLAQTQSAPQPAAETAALIHDILAADEKIRTLTQAWMGEIGQVLDSVEVERKLVRAYQAL